MRAIWDETGHWGPLAWITHDAGFRAHHAHNSWLEQWLAIGVPGLAAWACFFCQTLVANVVALYREQGRLPGAAVLRGLQPDQPHREHRGAYNDMRWVIFVALAVKLALPDPPKRRAQPSAEPRRALGHGYHLEAVR